MSSSCRNSMVRFHNQFKIEKYIGTTCYQHRGDYYSIKFMDIKVVMKKDVSYIFIYALFSTRIM